MDKLAEATIMVTQNTANDEKNDYAPSVYSSEPPPAYVRGRPSAVQIARIAAVTLVAVSFILGFFMLASAYVTATLSCQQYYEYQQQDMQEDRPSFQHLVDPLQSDESKHNEQQHQNIEVNIDNKENSLSEADQIRPDSQSPVQIKLPLQLDFDELAGALIEKNQRSRMNCVVEKRRAEEVTDHHPRMVSLPFGLNLTTDPKYEHVTGERMAIFCESGNDQRHIPMEQNQQVSTAQLTPVVVPIPVQQHQPIHLPFIHQTQPQTPQFYPQPQHHHHSQPHYHSHPNQIPQAQPQEIISQRILPAAVLQRILANLPQPQSVETESEELPTIAAAIREDLPHILPFLEAREGRGLFRQAQVVNPTHLRPVAIPADVVRPPPLPQVEESAPPHLRPHYVQPRSVRSVSDELLHRREKRVKRCACSCDC